MLDWFADIKASFTPKPRKPLSPLLAVLCLRCFSHLDDIGLGKWECGKCRTQVILTVVGR